MLWVGVDSAEVKNKNKILIDMLAVLEKLINELRHLKDEGVGTVYCREETLEGFKEALKGSNLKSEDVPEVARSEGRRLEQKELSSMLDKEAMSEAIGMKGIPQAPVVELPSGNKETRWEWLRARVLNCPVCNEHVKPGKKIVFGVGNVDADIFFCGEAPGADEEIQGEPFVGKAGQLLTKIIQAMGLSREKVYIGNIMNWRPEMPTAFGNRPPTQTEMNFCLPYLKAQVEVVKPKVIVALGATAVSGLLGPNSVRRMGDVRGKWHEFQGTPLMITFHPSYLLRNNTLEAKRMVWEDILKVMERVGMLISEKQQRYFLSEG